jgi:hypothetical protein
LFCGVKSTEIVQLAPPATELPQLFVWENAVLDIEILDIDKVPD